MSNYSEGTQVPFGDGSHVPPEEVSGGDFESETTMQSAMKNIFLSCDPTNSNSAKVSDLINFMIPHMQEHASQLTILKNALDPNNTDPCYVTSQTFYKIMMEWTSQFMGEGIDDKSSSVSDLKKEKDTPYSSLSKTNVGQRFLKGCIESDMNLNLSNSPTNNSTDVSILQEKINELEHQNRKLTDELEESRSQLTNSEEQNEALQADVQKLAHRLQREQQTNTQLEKDRQNTEELMEASSVAQKQVCKLEKDLTSSEKQVAKLKQQIHNLETENQKFEDKIDQLMKRETESKQLIQTLQTELHVKEQEIATLEDTFAQAAVRLNEQKQLVSHYANVNKSLKEDKLKMEKHYCDVMKTRIVSSHAPVPRTFSESSISSRSEHSFGRPRSKSASSSSPSNVKNITDISYEDDPLLWKSSQKVAPHESLEAEISQAKLVDTENLELKNTVDRLTKENNRLKSQISANMEKLKNYSPERRDLETECKALKVRIQDLESDSNHKYIKIIDLMEEKEKLHKELKRVNGKDADEIKKLQQNISDLHHEKNNILRELQQRKSEKQNSDTIISHLQSVKHECDLLQTALQHSKLTGEELCRELEKISMEKCGLRVKFDKLKKSMSEVNDKNKELNTKLQSVSDEYVKLKKNIKLRSTDDAGLLKTYDIVNTQDNKGLICEQKTHVFEEIESGKIFLLEEEKKTLKSIITLNECTIVSLKKELADLSAVNSKLSQSTTEKENQIVALKQLIAHQNESLKEITNDKETSTTKLYEQKSENEKLYENNKELTKTNGEMVKQMERIQKEKEYLCLRLSNLEEENKSILAEFKIITGDYKNMKDSDNKLMKEYKSLVTEKEILSNRYEQLTNDYKKIKELKEDIEQQLQDMKNEAVNLSSSPKQHSPTRERTLHLSPRRKSKEEAHDHNRYTKALSKIRQKMDGLENTNKQLQSENETLQEEFNKIKNTYETLTREKEIWVTEKGEWLQLKDELSQKLTEAMSESKLLEEQLNNTNKASLESLHKSNSSCSNCPILKSEVEDLNNRLNELQKQNNKIIQSRRYDRMQTTIEKLKQKSFGTEEELKSEKEKITNLELKISQLKTEMDKNNKKYATLETENSRLHNVVKENLNHYKKENTDLIGKLSNLEEQLKKLQKVMKELEQEKKFVSQECNGLKEKLESSVKEKENRVKSINKETNQLKQEVQELVKQKTKLEKKLATADNLLKCKLNVDKINKENIQLKQEIEEANKQTIDFQKKIENLEQDLKEKLDLEQKLKDYQESVAQEKLNIKEQVEDLEKKLEKTQRDLQKSETRNLSIRKELVDEQTMQGSDYTAAEKLLEENYCLQKQLKNYENELEEIKVKLNDSSKGLRSLNEHVIDVNQKLKEKRQKLNRSTLTAVNNWRVTLENDPNTKPVVEIFDKEELTITSQMFVAPLDEEMCKIKHQIHVTSLVLDTLGKFKISRLSRSDSESQPSTVSPSSPKSVKKIIPKTKTVLSRSVSPTKRAKPGNTDTSLVRSITAPALSTRTSDPSSRNDVKLSRLARPSSPTKNIKCNSKSPNQSRETSPENKLKTYVSSGSCCCCEVDTNLACYKSEDDFREDGMGLEQEEVELGLGANQNTPSLSSSTLESLGLLYEGDSPNWSKKEIEEKFHILVTCFMMDVVTIKDRQKKQQIYQSKIEHKFTMESEKVVTVLKDIKQLDRDQQIKVLVTTCLSHIKQMVGMFSHTANAAMQSGALQHEQHSLKIFSVMINHAANLRQVVENASPRLKSIGSSSSKYKKSPEVLSQNSAAVCSVCELQKDKCQESPEINEVEENKDDIRSSALVSSGFISRDERRENDNLYNPGLIQNVLLFCLLLFLTIIVVVGLIGFNSSPNGNSAGRYPWHWVSWDELFAPFVKRTYPNGPPPT